MSQDGDERYMSLVGGDSSDGSPQHQTGMDDLLQLAESAAGQGSDFVDYMSPMQRAEEPESDNLRAQVLKFSNELMSLTNRVSELSNEKLKIEFENRDLKARSAPVQIELSAVKDENTFLKAQLKEFWTEVEKISKEKGDIYKARCEAVRRLTDELSAARSEADSAKGRLELAEAERDRYRKQAQVAKSEAAAKHDQESIEMHALKEKISKQEKLISTLEQRNSVQEKLQENLEKVESQLADKTLELVDSNAKVVELTDAICDLKSEKEKLLKKIVHDQENRKSVAAAELLLGRSGWSLGDLVDELSHARKEIVTKRKEIDSLHTAIEDMKAKMPGLEENYMELQRCQLELEDVRKYNEELKSEYEKREDVIDELRFESMKLETDAQSAKIRSCEFTKQVAALVHENESLRARMGIHAGPGRTNPRLSSAAALPAIGSGSPRSPSAKAIRLSVADSMGATSVAHFRTVLDLVEQNAELKEKVDKLLSHSETEAQMELTKLRSQYEKIDNVNKDLLAKREEDKSDFDRVVARLESQVRKAQADAERLRKVVIGETDVDMEEDEKKDQGRVAILKSQLKICRSEFNKHLDSLKGELETARAVSSKTAVELDRIREDLKREIDEKHYYLSSYERLKSDSTQSIEKAKQLVTRLNAVEVERDALIVKIDELRSTSMLADQSKRELEHKVANFQSTVTAIETAFSQLSAEKESQSAVLIGYHQRLEKESALYQTNSDALKRLYQEESDKNRETLHFYQSAYEEQVRRASELSVIAHRAQEQLAQLQDEKSRIEKELDDSRLRLRVRESSAASESVSSGSASLQREVSRLESVAKSAEDEARKWRDLCKVNEALVDELRGEIARIESEMAAKDARISELGANKREDVCMEEAVPEMIPVEPPSTEQIEDLQARIAFLTSQVDDKASEISILEQQLREANVAHSEDVKKLIAATKKVHDLQEQIHRDRLVVSTKDGSLADQANILRSKLEATEAQKKLLEQRLDLLKEENEKYLHHFAADLSSSEKEESGRKVIQQLQSSMSVHLGRETQLVSDLERSRATNELLVRENRQLKSVVEERDSLLNQLASSQEQLQVAETQMAQLEVLREERDRLASDLEAARNSLAAAGQTQRDLTATKDKLAVIESADKKLKAELEVAKSQAAEYRQMHEELSVKLASMGGAESAGEEIEKLRNDYAKLDKAKSQLTSTISKLREEATKKSSDISVLIEKSATLETQLVSKDKELSRHEGLMNIKDKRISELESSQSAGNRNGPSGEQVRQLMDLVNAYQAALAVHQSPKHKRVTTEEPVEEEAMSKKPRQSVYHDAQDGGMAE